ncbi:MAG: T9SS type A sorting domain-containing protein [bacterium]|nr:T9SS type A sorting domain-containing protein [bacterium]
MNPHISYYFYDSGSRYDLVYVYKDGDSWVEDIVDGGYYDTGKYNSIFLDSADLPHISYMGGPPDDLKYAYYDPNDIDDAPPTTPTGFALTHPIPNPSIGTATVSFALPRPCDINLSLYDIKGRKIATLAEGQYQPGEYPSEVSGLSSGIYLYRFVAGEFSDTKKMIVK